MPSSKSRRTSAATAAIVTSPSYGQPQTVET